MALVAVREGDLHAGIRQNLYQPQPDAAAAPGDERNPAGQFLHDFSDPAMESCVPASRLVRVEASR
jgi:hypothetical protein